jgi:hypothetical protein
MTVPFPPPRFDHDYSSHFDDDAPRHECNGPMTEDEYREWAGSSYEPPHKSWRMKDDGSRIGYDCWCAGSRHKEGWVGPRFDHDWEGWLPIYAEEAAALEAEFNEGNAS